MFETEFKSPQEYLLRAYQKATESPDPSTQNGAVIVADNEFGYKDEFPVITVTACNTFPKRVQSKPERLVRPLKYHYIEHAERGAIYQAAQEGICLFGATMYVPWFACADCARAIICSGIKKVVGHQRMFDETPERWKESIAEAFNMMHEAGVETDLIQDVPGAPQILFNEQPWWPDPSLVQTGMRPMLIPGEEDRGVPR